jgi:hypothetical protein
MLSTALALALAASPINTTCTSSTTLRRYREAAITNAAAADLSAAHALTLQRQLADLQNQPPPAAPEPTGPPWAWILGAGGVGLAVGAVAMGIALTVKE